MRVTNNNFNKRMREYADKWVVRRGDNGTYYIPHKYGRIEPWGLVTPIACAICTFSTSRAKTFAMQKIARMELQGYRLEQEGDEEVVFTFFCDSRALSRVSVALYLKRKRRYPNRKLAGAALATKQRKTTENTHE